MAKHAAAFADVVRREDILRVEIRDDGQGGADPDKGGVAQASDRVAGVDGRLIVLIRPVAGPS